MSVKTASATLGLCLILSTSVLAASKEFKGVAKYLGKKSSMKSNHEHGMRYIALTKALNACKKSGNKYCVLTEYGEPQEKYRSVSFTMSVQAVEVKSRITNYRVLSVNSGDWVSDAKFSKLALDSIRLSTLQKAIKECHKEDWRVCSIVGVEDDEINKRFFDSEWGQYAYKASFKAKVKGINP